jgi:hypothetical protein
MCKEVTTQGKQQEKVKEHACMEEDFVLTIYGKPANQDGGQVEVSWETRNLR